MFLNRTSGESIGFTVLGIMVIDKNAIISVSSYLQYRAFKISDQRHDKLSWRWCNVEALSWHRYFCSLQEIVPQFRSLLPHLVMMRCWCPTQRSSETIIQLLITSSNELAILLSDTAKMDPEASHSLKLRHTLNAIARKITSSTQPLHQGEWSSWKYHIDLKKISYRVQLIWDETWCHDYVITWCHNYGIGSDDVTIDTDIDIDTM